SVEKTSLAFHGIRSLKEFQKLLLTDRADFHDKTVSSMLDNLRNTNTEIFESFFQNIWKLSSNCAGLLILRLLDCSSCSTFDIAASHEQFPSSKHSMCHVSAKFDIADMSHTLASPPDLPTTNTELARKMLAAYVCDAVRWSNIFTSLRMRWICLDKALAIGRRQTSGWPEMDPLHPYCTGEEQTVEESLQPSHNGNGKVVRRLSKKMTTSRAKTSWTGTRVELQLWCQAEDVPERMLSEDYRTALQNYQEVEMEGEEADSSQEYHFNLKYVTNVRATASNSQGFVQTTITMSESTDAAQIRQIKKLIST
ncbi:unnamed protein product, partial [Nesidiocoris tenuis]